MITTLPLLLLLSRCVVPLASCFTNHQHSLRHFLPALFPVTPRPLNLNLARIQRLHQPLYYAHHHWFIHYYHQHNNSPTSHSHLTSHPPKPAVTDLPFTLTAQLTNSTRLNSSSNPAHTHLPAPLALAPLQRQRAPASALMRAAGACSGLCCGLRGFMPFLLGTEVGRG